MDNETWLLIAEWSLAIGAGVWLVIRALRTAARATKASEVPAAVQRGREDNAQAFVREHDLKHGILTKYSVARLQETARAREAFIAEALKRYDEHRAGN
jgi:hypothetical protein